MLEFLAILLTTRKKKFSAHPKGVMTLHNTFFFPDKTNASYVCLETVKLVRRSGIYYKLKKNKALVGDWNVAILWDRKIRVSEPAGALEMVMPDIPSKMWESDHWVCASV